MTDAPDRALEDAVAAAQLLAVDPKGLGGVWVRARSGPGRDAFLAAAGSAWPDGTPTRTVPSAADDDRLLGGLDLAAALGAGRAIVAKGVLAEADGGVLRAPSAERMDARRAARIAAAMDDGAVVVARDGASRRDPARFALVLLDEGAEPDEAAPDALIERCAFHIAPPERPVAAQAQALAAVDAAAARERLPSVSTPEGMVEAAASAAAALGVASLRAPLFVVRAARASAALGGRSAPSEDDLELAARLVLAPRSVRTEAQETLEDTPEDEPPERAPPDAKDSETEDPQDDGRGPLEERILDAARADVPADLLAALAARAAASRAAAPGGAGAAAKRATRGRPIGARPGRPAGDDRLALTPTLRAAAPWARLRGGGPGLRPRIRAEDLRIRRFADRAETTTILAIDASGSAAAQRLAEAKGAVEALLGEAYVRRDRVALIAFRGDRAELIAPPTRALARARRALTGLPGGGGTPIADAVDLVRAVAEGERRAGRTTTIVFLTDGGANVGRGGAHGRAVAAADAMDAAVRLRALGLPTLLIEASARPRPAAAALAEALGAERLFLPSSDPAAVGAAARALSRPNQRL